MVEKLSWAQTARAMAASHEDWIAWDTTAGDGLDHVPAWDHEDRARMRGRRPGKIEPLR
jgi:hypothetical protein